MRIVTTYDTVTHQATKSAPCPVCGRKVRRQRTFRATVNPWNRNPDGSVRSRAEVFVQLRQDALAWSGTIETHPGCAT